MKQQGRTFRARDWHRLGRYLIWLGPILVIGAIVISQLRRADVEGTRRLPLPQDAQVQAYFNHVQAHSYPEPYRHIIRPGQDLEQVMVSAIQQARRSIDVAVQEFRLPKIAEALAERRRAGVTVRIVMENNYTRPWAVLTAGDVAQLDLRLRQRYQEWQQLVDLDGNGQITAKELQQRDVLTILQHHQIPWLDDTADGSMGSMLMHHKFLVVDGRTVVATSANFTPSDIHGDLNRPDTRGNANSLLLIQSPELAQLFTQEFNFLWGDGPGGLPNSRFGVNKPLRPPQQIQVGATRITVKFSPARPSTPWPQTTNGLIGKTLARAKTSINLALFVFSDQELANRLERIHPRVRQLRILVDPEFIYRDFSEALDLIGLQMANTAQARRGKCFYEPGNHPWAASLDTIGSPNLARGDKLHHKFGELDGQIVIMGSHNWSESANWGNDEFLLVVESPVVTAHYRQEFERLYANSQLGRPRWLQSKIERQRQACGGNILASAPISAKTPALTDEPTLESLDPLDPDPARPTIASRPASPSPAATLPIATTRSVATPQASSSTNPGKINLNTASQSELESLPGVGPKLAKAILAARQQQPFTSLADLDQVPGVGPALLQRLQDRVTW
jgi:competence ComEA-like helix-hairpin-helix protein